MTKFQQRHPIPPRFLELAGEITAQWTFVEYVLLQSICEITEIDTNKGFLVGWNLGFWSRIHTLQAYANAAKSHDEQEGKRILKAIQDIIDAYAIRNKYAHAYWLLDQQTGTPRLVDLRIKGRLAIEDSEITVDQMEADSDAIWDAADAFITLMQEYDLLKTML